MEDILCQLKNLLASSKSPQETLPILKRCYALFTSYDGNEITGQLPALLEALLASVVKPLFANTAKTSTYRARLWENSSKPWKETAPWAVDVMKWTLDSYDKLDTSLRKQTIESQFSLIVPPILALLDDDDLISKTRGCDFLQILCSRLISCESAILERTGLTQVFEDSLAPNTMLLPSLIPEEQSLEILGSLYPAYRALVGATFPARSPNPTPNRSNLITKASQRQSISQRSLVQRNEKQAILDRMLRNGILAGYIHASDHVQIATLLVSELSYVVVMMGSSSAKYLSQLLPLLRNILTNPLGIAHPPLLVSAISAMRGLVIQCRPRIAQVWWEECLRTMIGLWLVLSEEEDDSKVQNLKEDTKGLTDLLLQLKGHSEVRKDLDLLQAECQEMKSLLSG